MTYTKRSLYFLILFSLAAVLSGCMSENDKFIQGRWYYSDPHLQKVIAESAQESFWTFDNGTYSRYECCFAEVSETGRYEIIKSEEDKLVLELFNRNGSVKAERAQIAVAIDRDGGTIKIGRAGPFTRDVP
jgi:hypothetical protein